MAIELEAQAWLDERASLLDERGGRLVVRNGRQSARLIQTGVGDLEVIRPRIHDRRIDDEHEAWPATREAAHAAFDAFVEDYGAKYAKTTACLKKDRDVLLTFYDFPAEHWRHLRTTNPIESTFATVRLRHRRTKGNGSRGACLAMVFKLARSAEKSWRKLNGHKLIPDVIRGVRFTNGVTHKAAA